MQIELNAATITMAVTALGSLLTATWALSRRSHGWDQTEAHERLLHGDKESSDPLLNRGLVGVLRDHLGARNPGDALPEVSFKTALSSITSLADQQKRWQKGTGTHGSDEHSIAIAFRTSVASEVEVALDEKLRQDARTARLHILADQARRFGEEIELPAVEEDDPFPEPTPRRAGSRPGNRLRTPVLQREDLDEGEDRPSRPVLPGRRRRDGGE